MAGEGHIGPGLFEFLADLAENNNREWFQANKARYESQVKEPLLRFVADFDERLGAISEHFVADPRPVGGSMFRIYRDLRFSRDKRPYKTNAGLQFRHEAGRNAHAPGFYLHLEPGKVFGGGGVWHPDSAALRKIRDAIVATPSRWEAAKNNRAMRDLFTLEGESLKRPPRGYDPEHPHVDDLKRKDFVFGAAFSDEEVCAPDFIDRYAAACRVASPLMRFLTEALGLPW